MFTGIFCGFVAWLVFRFGFTSLYTVDQNERAVKTTFGRACRLPLQNSQGEKDFKKDPLLGQLRSDEVPRYTYPKVEVIPSGGPYFKWPWEKIYKVSIATQTENMAHDPDSRSANRGGTVLEAVTKDQLNTNLIGQIRYRVSERNLYPFIFGVKNPFSHVMGYFVSILRERIANFEAPRESSLSPVVSADSVGVSINDLRKNLRDLNEHMAKECEGSEARYGVILDASLITGIEPPVEVESALAAINTAHNHVSSDISLAQAKADQTIEQSKKAVEIETLKAQAEVEPLIQLAEQLKVLKQGELGHSEKNREPSRALSIYRRNINLGLFKRAQKVIWEVRR